MISEDDRSLVMVLVAAVGGSVVSLWNMPWKDMSWQERLFVFCGGMACGIFGAPWVARLMGISTVDLSERCGIVFFGAAFGLLLLPSLQTRLRMLLGLKKDGEA